MKWAVVNFEYEFDLFKDHLANCELKNSDFFQEVKFDLEYTFFFIEKDQSIGLAARNNYSSEYIDYLKGLGLDGFTIKPIEEVEVDKFNWVGALSDFETERSLNSKLWMYEKLGELGLINTQFKVVEDDQEDLKSRFASRIFVKNPFLFSGKGNKKLDNIAELSKKDQGSIVEPVYDIVEEVSFYFDHSKDKNPQAHLNRSTSNGLYSGGRVYKSSSDFLENLRKLKLDKLFEEQREIVEKFSSYLYSNHDLKQDFSIDGFYYKEKEAVKCYPISDLNYRVSFGKLIHSLKQFLPENGVGELLFIRKKAIYKNDNFNSRKLRSYSLEIKKGVIVLSPESSNTLCLFLVASDEEELSKVIMKILIVLGLRST